MLLLLIACTGAPPAPDTPPAPPEAEAAVVAVPKPARYVVASSLNVRAEPSADARLLARLPINTSVLVLATEGDWVRVQLATGLVGWVGAKFLGDERLTLTEARSHAGSDDALAWAQRAAALAPDNEEVLGELAAAYRAAGDAGTAKAVEKQIADRHGKGPYERWLDQDLRTDIDQLRTRMDAMKTVADFAATRKEALDIARRVSDAIMQHYDWESGSFGDGDIDWVEERLPGMQTAWYAEGTVVEVELAIAPWRDRAAQTEGTLDDDFVALVDASYGNFNAGGWPLWDERTWDYGGCSRLGSGVHRDVLKLADRVKPPFADTAAEIRERVVRSIVLEETEFPFCDPATSTPTPKDALVTEIDQILEQVTGLTDEQRKQLEARKATL